MERFDYSLAAGEDVRLPGGNQLFVYQITGAESVQLRFWMPDGKNMGPFSECPVGLRYGPGVPRRDGSSWWQWAELKNHNAVPVTVSVYVSDAVIDLSAISPLVTVSGGQIDADVFSGAVEYAKSVSRTGENSAAYNGALDITFVKTFSALAAGATKRVTFYAKLGGNLAQKLPHQIAIQSVAVASLKAASVEVGRLTPTTGITGTALTNVEVVTHQGGTGDYWPGSQPWPAFIREDGIYLQAGGPVALLGAGGGVAEKDFSLNPVLVEGYENGDGGGVLEIGGRSIVVKNLDAGAQDVTLIVTARLIPEGP